MNVYNSYSVMAILAWIVLVSDDDRTEVTIKQEQKKLSETAANISS